MIVVAPGPDLVGRGSDPVPPRRRDAAHRDDQRFAGGAEGEQRLTDDLGREGAAARGVDPQHQRRDVLVVGRLIDQACQCIAADVAGRLFAVEDHAAGDDHADRWTLAVLRKVERRAHRGEVIAEAQRLHVALVVLADELLQRLVDRRTPLQRVDEPVFQRGRSGVAAVALEDIVDLVRVVVHRFRRQLAPARHAVRERAPDLAQQFAGREAIGLGHVAAFEELEGRLERAGAEHVQIHAQLLERTGIVVAVRRVARQLDGAERVHPDLVGLRGEQVLVLRDSFYGYEGLDLLIAAMPATP